MSAAGHRPLVVVVGDVLLDRTVDGSSERLSPDAPVPVLDVAETVETPGGAGLAATMCADSGADVVLIAPMSGDAAGARLRELLANRMRLISCGHRGPTRRKTRLRSGGQPLVRVDDGGPGDPTDMPLDHIRDVLRAADAVLVSDYGAGVTRHEGLRAALADVAPDVPVIWDPHPRGARPIRGTCLATPNLAEARAAALDMAPGDTRRPLRAARRRRRPARPAVADGGGVRHGGIGGRVPRGCRAGGALRAGAGGVGRRPVRRGRPFRVVGRARPRGRAAAHRGGGTRGHGRLRVGGSRGAGAVAVGHPADDSGARPGRRLAGGPGR